MHKYGKRYREQAAKIDATKSYTPREAVGLAKDTSYAKFNATVEVHMRLGVDPKHADQNVRDVVVLPHGLGKVVRVLVFADGEGGRIAQEAGADIIADDETIKRIQEGWAEFDVAIATPDMMGKVGRLGRVLGPRGLMPNPKDRHGGGLGRPAAGGARGQGRPRGVPRGQDRQPARADRQGVVYGRSTGRQHVGVDAGGDEGQARFGQGRVPEEGGRGLNHGAGCARGSERGGRGGLTTG